MLCPLSAVLCTGVTAINLEALQMMRRGAPPQGANPFPAREPLTASTAAAGLAAAAGEQQYGSAGGVGDSGAAAEQPVDGLTATLQDWALTQQEQQGAAAVPAAAGNQVSYASPAKTQAMGADAGPAGWPAAGGYNYGMGQPQSSPTVASSLSSQAQSVYGAAAVVQLQPHGQQQHVGAAGGRLGFAASPQQPRSPGAGAGAPVPRVYVERGPARAPLIAAAQAQKAAASSSSPQTGRAAGVRRFLHSASSGKASQGHGGR
jgi:hypothetical protein